MRGNRGMTRTPRGGNNVKFQRLIVMMLMLGLALVATPAWAQYPPPPPSPSPSPSPSPGVDITIQNKNVTIHIECPAGSRRWEKCTVTVTHNQGSQSTAQSNDSAPQDTKTTAAKRGSNDRELVAQVASGPDGPVSQDIQLPPDLEPGDYQLKVEGTNQDGQAESRVMNLRVEQAAGPRPEQAGASNGFGITPLHVLIAMLLVVGAALLAYRRRQQG